MNYIIYEKICKHESVRVIKKTKLTKIFIMFLVLSPIIGVVFILNMIYNAVKYGQSSSRENWETGTVNYDRKSSSGNYTLPGIRACSQHNLPGIRAPYQQEEYETGKKPTTAGTTMNLRIKSNNEINNNIIPTMK